MDISIEDFDQLTGEVRALKALCLHLRDIVEGGISSNNLHTDAVQTNNIKDDSIIADKIKALSIDASKIAVGTITSDQIKEGTIAADRLKVGDITALQISSGSITAGLLKTGGQAFSHNLTFSSTDANTVTWTAGTLKTADGTSYSIDAGDTGNMAARTYIYLDKGISETVLQTSTSYDAPLGDERIPIATAKNGTGNAILQVFSGGGGVFISGGMIAAHTISATQITSKTITSTEIIGETLSAIRANCGTITAGTIDGARFKVGGYGGEQEIYFKDSGIWMYDSASGSLKRITLSYGASNYMSFTHYTTGTTYSELWMDSGGTPTAQLGINSAGRGYFNVGVDFNFYSTGTLQMPSKTSAPTAHTGDYAYKNVSPYQMMFYNGTGWEYALDGSGW